LLYVTRKRHRNSYLYFGQSLGLFRMFCSSL